jgi:hypothetical protein
MASLLFVGMWGPTIPPVSTAVGDELVVAYESLCLTFLTCQMATQFEFSMVFQILEGCWEI